MNPFKIIFILDKLLAKLETFLLTSTVLGLLFFAFLQVVLRNVFDSGIHWADVFNRSMVLWIGFFGATLAAKENKHLSLEVLTNFLPDRAKPLISILTNLFVIVVCFYLTHYSHLFYIDQITYEASDLLFEGFPKAYFTIIFPIGFGILTFRYFVKLLETIYKFGGGDKEFDTSCEHLDIDVKIKLK